MSKEYLPVGRTTVKRRAPPKASSPQLQGRSLAAWGGKTGRMIAPQKTALFESAHALGKSGLRFGLKEKAEEARRKQDGGKRPLMSGGFSYKPRRDGGLNSARGT